MAEGKSRPVTEYFDVPEHISFKEFNNYINELDYKEKYERSQRIFIK